MAAISSIVATGTAGSFSATKSTLSSSDTITIASGKLQLLVLDNVTAGELTLKIDGDGGTTVKPPGLGVVTVSGGYDIVLAAGAQAAVILSTISAYTKGVVTLSGASGVKAQLFDV